MASATVSVAPVPLPTVEHPLKNANYRLWLIGGTISFLGDQFYLVALPWLVLQQTGSAVAMGAIMMGGAIPRAVLMLMGGAVSDRLSARKIMMATATARTVCVTVIGLLVWLRVLQTWELYALAFAFGAADVHALARQARTTCRGFLRQPKHRAADHHCWPHPRRLRDPGIGRRLGLLRGRHQFSVHYRRALETARSSRNSVRSESDVALDRRRHLLRCKGRATALLDVAGHHYEPLRFRADRRWSRVLHQNKAWLTRGLWHAGFVACCGKPHRRGTGWAVEDPQARHLDSSCCGGVGPLLGLHRSGRTNLERRRNSRRDGRSGGYAQCPYRRLGHAAH